MVMYYKFKMLSKISTELYKHFKHFLNFVVKHMMCMKK